MNLKYTLAISSLFLASCGSTVVNTPAPVSVPATPIEIAIDDNYQDSADATSESPESVSPALSTEEQFDLDFLAILQADEIEAIVLQKSLSWLAQNPISGNDQCIRLSAIAALLYNLAGKLPALRDNLNQSQEFYLQIADTAAQAALACRSGDVDGQPYGLSGHLTFNDVDSRPALLIYYLALKSISQLASATTNQLIKEELTKCAELLGPIVSGQNTDYDLINRAFCGLNTDHLTLFLCGRNHHE